MENRFCELLESFENNLEERFYKLEKKLHLFSQNFSDFSESLVRIEDEVIKIRDATSLNRFSIEKGNCKVERLMKNHQFDPEDVLGSRLNKIETGISNFSRELNDCFGSVLPAVSLSLSDNRKLCEDIKEPFKTLTLALDNCYSTNKSNHVHLLDQLTTMSSDIMQILASPHHVVSTPGDVLMRPQLTNTESLDSDTTLSVEFNATLNSVENSIALHKELQEVLDAASDLPLPGVVKPTLRVSGMESRYVSFNLLQEALGTSINPKRKCRSKVRRNNSNKKVNAQAKLGCDATVASSHRCPSKQHPVISNNISPELPCGSEGLVVIDNSCIINPELPYGTSQASRPVVTSDPGYRHTKCIFLSRLDPSFTTEALEFYINQKLNSPPVRIEKMRNCKNSDKYASFKLFVGIDHFSTLNDPAFWFRDMVVHEFKARNPFRKAVRTPPRR